MSEAAFHQGLDIGKEHLRNFLESSDTGRQAMAMSGAQGYGGRRGGRDADEISMDTLNGDGTRKRKVERDEDAMDLDDI
jgi:hypothetical protein